MKYEISYSGKRIKVRFSGENASTKELKNILKLINESEHVSSEQEIRAKVIRQIKTELLDTELLEETNNPGWWDVPSDLFRNKESSSFMQMEADLNAGMVYEKLSFPLKVMISESGKQLTFDREKLRHAFQKLSLQDKLKATQAVLVRVKGALSPNVVNEIEDFVKGHLQIERFKLVAEKKQYGDRISLELVLFGDFSFE